MSILGSASTGAYAKAIVVSHDVNTLATFVSGAQGTYAVVNVPVPEPATVVLFGASLLALAGVGRRSVAQ